MSKASRPRDLRRHLGQAMAEDSTGWCPGCGLYPAVNNGQHRNDCTRGKHARHDGTTGAAQ